MFVVQDKMSKLLASRTRVPRKPRKDSLRLSNEFSPYALPVLSARDIIFSTLSPAYNKAIGIPYLEQCFDEVTLLGEGSYGVVYKALCKDDRKWYAVKKYKRPFRDQLHRQRLLEVVGRHMKISCNEHIVQCVHAWEEGGHLFVQMELCSGTLYHYLADWKEIKEHKLWNVMLDLTLGIKHLHSQEFIHLDIKPENILVTDEGVFKLGDFGLIHQINNNGVNDAEDGDSRYLAPEVLQEIFTKPADIFSLGMTLLEVATDIVLPGEGPLWHELRNDCIPDGLLLNTSKEFRDVIRKMLSRDPLSRPTVEQLLQHRRLRLLQISRSCLYVPNQMVRTIKHCYCFTKNAVSNCGLIISQALGFWKGRSDQDSEPAVTPVKNSSHVSSTPRSTASEGRYSTPCRESSDEDADGHCSFSPVSSSDLQSSQWFASLSPSTQRWMKLSSCKKRLLQDEDSSSDSVSPYQSRSLKRDIPWNTGRRLFSESDLEEDNGSVCRESFEKSLHSSSHDERRLFSESDFEEDNGSLYRESFEKSLDSSSHVESRLSKKSCVGDDSGETSGYSSPNDDSAAPSSTYDIMAADKQTIVCKMRVKRKVEQFSMVLRKRVKAV
ncbi:membrane-associated tyrosine- and threonine-specific cdc2-inhibitory kinase [Anabrus simplex]|uniref:membrane-associated tyrosine- and threonine-specific cdc2-inhibitory kinase n=1 Tax=Anabrus simplex TaxID=316456 RepID=UPI0035A365EA